MDAARELPQIELPAGTLVIADLHLDLGDPAGGAEFVRWLSRAGPIPALVVLGDLFDAWVGPAQMRMPGAALVLDALRDFTRHGAELFVVHGNRDFLLERRFEERTGARVLPEGFVALVPDGAGATQRVLFVHGDTLCTLDVAYQRLRRVVRSRTVRWLAPRVPLPIGTAIARRLRRASVRAVAAKPVEEKSVQRGAADALARTHAADLVVCGHAHEFRDEALPSGARWMVLDAFGGARDVLRAGGVVESSRLHTAP